MLRSKKIFVPLITLIIVLTMVGLPFPSAASEQTITILFTHDLHDHLLPYTTLQKDGSSAALGGFARLQSAIYREREKDPDLLLVDAGDFSMGTLFQTIFASHAPQLRLLGHLGYDATTFGNHEFDFRALGLAESLTTAINSGDPLPQITLANVSFPKDEAGELTPSLEQLRTAMNNYPVEDYIVVHRNGIKIGIFGIMGKDSASNAPMSEVKFTDAVENAQRVVDILQNQEQVDLIICISHSGTAGTSPKTEDEILAKKVPGIHVIISGHSHTELPRPLIVGKTIIGSSGEYGRNLGIIKISQDLGGGWTLKEYALKPLDESIPSDPKINSMIQEYQQAVEENYLARFDLGFDEIVADSPFSFTAATQIGARHGEEPLGNLIGDAYIYATQLAEGSQYEPIAAALAPKGTIRGSFVQGPISVADVFIVSSLGIGEDGIPGYPLVNVYLTGKELKTMCEIDASVAPIMGAAQLYISGLSYQFNPNRLIFNKVTSVNLQNPDGSLAEIDDNQLYRVVAGLYSGQMLPAVNSKSFGILSVIPKTKDGTPITDFEKQIIRDKQGNEIKEWYAIAQYLKSFDLVDGVPSIPLYYSAPQGRKIVDHSNNILQLLRKPNKIALIVYLIIIILIFLLVAILIKTVRSIKKKRKRTGPGVSP